MFLRIPLNTDLAAISYRWRVDTEADIYIEYIEGPRDPLWPEVSLEEVCDVAPEYFKTYTTEDAVSLLKEIAKSINPAFEQYYNEVNAALFGGE